LRGRHVELVPLAAEHAAELLAAATVDRSSYGFTEVPGDADHTDRYIANLLAKAAGGTDMPFAQRRVADGRIVGCTRYLEIRRWRGRPEPDEVEIGGTWLGAEAQRTAINTEAKYLLLSHAFETIGVWRVAICTDARNERSRTAILRIGATFEGVLRNHRMRYNTPRPEPRDSAVYSITDDEWPAVKQLLEQRLAER
jgi:RimJ/RimL family protein N-acetyltransferase